MKIREFVFSFFLLMVSTSSGQIFQPVKWSFEPIELENNEAELVFKAKIDKGWHLYSQFIAEGGPIPTSFSFDSTGGFSFLGSVKEKGKPEEAYDPNFDITLKWFSNEVEFIQKIKLRDSSVTVKGFLEFMTCDDQRCLPPDQIEFSFSLNAKIVKPDTTAANSEMPQLKHPEEKYSQNFKSPVRNCIEKEEPSDMDFFTIFLLGFLSGLIALITPCVFPMIPLTVSFFTKQTGNTRKGIFNAVSYGICIAFIYFLLSVPFLIWDVPPDVLNEFSTNVWVNFIFFVVFLVFAISFFGYFEITLPGSMANKADTASGLGGLPGIFFMALTLAIVSFSCTGPILGTLLAGTLASEGGSANLAVGMTAFGIALGLPFALFAAFPQWLNSLPKSGGWLNSVKVVLGFLEVALALKFLSNADLVAHWGILKREVFLGLWILTGSGLTLYLFGKIRFPHDNPVKKLSAGRIILALLSLAFVIYLIPGMWGANLKLLSGFPPPMFYSIAETKTKCPLNIPCYHDYEVALKQAKTENKPLIIDFTGWACVNCRKMEENVWVKPEVYKRLMEDYILVSLYVDDKEKLPEEKQYISSFSGKKIKTIGNKWSDFQAENFGSNSQPFYVLLSPDEKLLTHPIGYTPDSDEYIIFLDCGKDAFSSRKEKTIL